MLSSSVSSMTRVVVISTFKSYFNDTNPTADKHRIKMICLIVSEKPKVNITAEDFYFSSKSQSKNYVVYATLLEGGILQPTTFCVVS